MKEAYFTSETIASQAQGFYNLVGRRKRFSQFPFEPDNAGLLVLDMQDYFLASPSHAFVPSAPAILPNVNALIRAFKSRNRPVIYTRHINTRENAGMLALWWREVINPENPLAALNKTLDVDPASDLVLDKTRYDAFHNTPLDSILASKNVHSLVITGVMTHLCCETTARAAFTRDYVVYFALDATATYTAELHLSSLRTLSHGFAIPELSVSIVEKMR